MAKTFRPFDRDQMLLMPPSLHDWVSEDHLARFIADVVETLDLSAIEDTYTEERGYPPYDPRMMVGVLLYAYCTGTYSSRKIAAKLADSVAFRFLAASNQPDFEEGDPGEDPVVPQIRGHLDEGRRLRRVGDDEPRLRRVGDVREHGRDDAEEGVRRVCLRHGADGQRPAAPRHVEGLFPLGNKMLRSREEARTPREMLSFTKKKDAEPLLEYLLGFRTRMGQAQRLLTDVGKTAFFFVTLPEALPIAVIKRFIGWFHEFGIPVGGVIVNMIIDRKALGADVPEFVLNRMQMQDEHMVTIREKFDGSVRAVVPLFDEEVRGTAMLGRAAAALFG